MDFKTVVDFSRNKYLDDLVLISGTLAPPTQEAEPIHLVMPVLLALPAEAILRWLLLMIKKGLFSNIRNEKNRSDCILSCSQNRRI